MARKTRRTKYRNGDTIALPGGCDGCSPAMVSGVLCHEHGCPYAWRDSERGCSECGYEFRPEGRWQRVCGDCWE